MNTARRTRYLGACALLPLALAFSTSALAQDAVAAAEVADTSNDIIVTAQKRSERLQDVPISIQAMTSAEIERKGVMQVSALPQAIPALRINYAGTNIQPSIRGIGSLVAGPGLYANIPVYIDGYYVPSPGASDFDLINIAAVNVLKGPQGTLFGFNATGGAIQLITRDPQFDPTMIARLTVGTHGQLGATFYGSTGITSNLAMDVAASYAQGDGFTRNIVTNDQDAGAYDRWSVRTKLLWEPTDGISFKLAYAHRQESNPRAVLTSARDGATVGINVPGNIIASDRDEVSMTGPAFFRVRSDSVTLTSNFDLGFADLTSYTGYRYDRIDQGLDYDTTPANIYSVIAAIPDKTITQEFNLTSKPGGPLSWVVGAFYMDATNTYHFNVNTPGGEGYGAPFTRLFNTENNLKSYAVFADATYEVIDNLFLTAGGRYSINKPHLNYELVKAGISDSGGTTFRDFSPRAVIRYEVSPQSSVYASYTKGYKTGTLPGSSFSLTPVDPETINAFEAGYKLANSLLRFNIAAYYYDYRDIQVTAYGTNGAGITRNAAKAEIYGLDGDLAINVTEDFSLNIGAAYTHAEYKDFPDAIGMVQVLDPTAPNYGMFTNVNIDASGLPVARTPRFAGNIGASYGVDLADARLVLNANLFHTSSFFFDSVKQLPQAAYQVLNLKATWTDPSDTIDVSVFGTNVTNTKYRAYSQVDSYSIRQTWGEPSMVGVSFTARY